MCECPFVEGTTGIIRLPDDDPKTLEAFHQWAYQSCLPLVHPLSTGFEIAKLAIFADKYRIHMLINQTTDYIRLAIPKQHFKPTPEMFDFVFANTATDCPLRELCVFGLLRYYPGELPDLTLPQWTAVFARHPLIGVLSFQQQSKLANVENRDACHWHDHSDLSKVKGGGPDCPYQFGVHVSEVDNLVKARFKALRYEFPRPKDGVKASEVEQVLAGGVGGGSAPSGRLARAFSFLGLSSGGNGR